jgi:hypothetical protein
MTCRGGVVSWGTKYRETGLINLARCVACGVWRVACGVWRVACGVWRVACAKTRESRAQEKETLAFEIAQSFIVRFPRFVSRFSFRAVHTWQWTRGRHSPAKRLILDFGPRPRDDRHSSD